MTLTPRALLLLASSLILAVIGCGDDDTDTGPDVGSDSGMDSGTGMDSGRPPRPDSGTDAGRDAGPDAGALSVGITCEEADVADADSVLGADVREDTTFRGLVHVTTAIDVAGSDSPRRSNHVSRDSSTPIAGSSQG